MKIYNSSHINNNWVIKNSAYATKLSLLSCIIKTINSKTKIMIRFILFISFYLLTLIGFSQTKEQTYKITETVVNAVNDKGTIHFSLYDSEENFNSRTVTAKATGALQDGVSVVAFTDVKPGVYAIICFHDANDNGKMDFEPTGMPLEDYGASNNIQSFGPPQFTDAKFEVNNTNLAFSIKF